MNKEEQIDFSCPTHGSIKDGDKFTVMDWDMFPRYFCKKCFCEFLNKNKIEVVCASPNSMKGSVFCEA
jgi:hypothetical protein